MYHQVDQTKKDQILLSYSIFVRNSKDFQYLNDTGGGHFEIGHFLTYAVIPEIPPNTVLKLKVSLTQINSQILFLRRCIRVSKAGPGLALSRAVEFELIMHNKRSLPCNKEFINTKL